MVEVTFAQLQGWLVAFLWPFIRLSSFFVASPLLGHSSIPNQVKIALAALLTFIVAPSIGPLPAVPLVSWAGLGIIIEQMLIGLSMGLIMHILFAAVQAAGEFIGLQMGLAFATFFSPDTGSNTMILSRLLYMITLLFFLALDGHLLLIQILANTFTSLPIGIAGLPNLGAFDLLARFGSTIFFSGMLLALPVMASLLTINLSLGILNRAAPQLTVFSVGFPLTLTMGIFLLMILMTDLGSFLERLFSHGLGFMQQFVEALAPF